MEVQTFAGKLAKANNRLVKYDLAIVTQTFKSDLMKLKTIKIPRWQNNDGSTGIFHSHHDQVLHVPRIRLAAVCEDSENQIRVTEWNDRNQEILQQLGEKCREQLKRTSVVGDDDQFCRTAGTMRKKNLIKEWNLRLPVNAPKYFKSKDSASNASERWFKMQPISESINDKMMDTCSEAPTELTFRSGRSVLSKATERALRAVERKKAKSIVSVGVASKRSITLIPSGFEAHVRAFQNQNDM